jgi:hypothetical protein
MEAMLNISLSVKEKGPGGASIGISTDFSGKQSLEEFSKFLRNTLIAVAADALVREQAKGFDKKPITLVDGSKNKPLQLVKPFGKIEFVSSQVQGLGVVKKAYEQILTRSKVVTGTYIEGNVVLFNGNVIAQNMPQLEAWISRNQTFKKGDVIRFVNVLPYARKLERLGVTAQRTKLRTQKSRDKLQRSGERILASNGAYFLAHRAIRREFKANVGVYFSYILGSTLGQDKLPNVSKGGGKLRRNYADPKKKKPNGLGPYLYPTIKIVIEEGGTI